MSALSGFDMEAYKSDLYYIFAPGIPALSKCIYLILGLVIPIMIGCGIEASKSKFIRNK